MTMESNSHTEPPLVLRESRDGVVTLCLNRPAQFNALSEAMLGALHEALQQVAADEAVRCVILAGAGKAFCAGMICARCAVIPIWPTTGRCLRSAVSSCRRSRHCQYR